MGRALRNGGGVGQASEPRSSAYGEMLKELARRRGETWEQIAAGSGVPASSLHQWKSGRRRPNAEQHRRLAAYLDEPRLDDVFRQSGASKPAHMVNDNALYGDWIGRWYEVVEVGDVRWEGRRIPRGVRTVDEAKLHHVGVGMVKGTLKRIVGSGDEGAVWDVEGRIVLGDGSLLLTYEEQRRTLRTASRGVIALKHAGGRTDHLRGMYAKFDYDVQLFVPRPLDWFRDKHEALSGTRDPVSPA